MNARQSITRKITYSIVTVNGSDTNYDYLVYGETNPVKETKKLLKDENLNYVPQVDVKVISEQRAISIENFITNSQIINEGEIL